MQQTPNIPQPGLPEQDNSGQFLTSPEPQREGWRSIVSTILLLLAAPLIALFLTSFVFQSYEVDGPSMETTLQHQDRLIVLKTGKTWSRITGQSFIPKRSDIIVFSQSGLHEFGEAGDKQLIKRVIALPGERVTIRDGVITVYNNDHPEGFNPDKESDYNEAIFGTAGNVDITVPENHVFVCGDNRANSLDSRNFGPVPTEQIIGTLALRIFPLNKVDAY